MTSPGPTFSTEHRQRLLDGLAESIREKGLVATQVSDIVRHAKASRRTFYESFPDKDACVLELARTLAVDVYAQLEQAADLSRPWDEVVDTLVDTYLEILASDFAMTFAFWVEIASLGVPGQRLRVEGLERYATLMYRLVRTDEMRAAGVRQISYGVAVMLIGGVTEMVTYAIHRGEPVQRMADDAKTAIKTIIGPPDGHKEA